MKSKDIIILQKILKYCSEIEDTCEHFDISLEEFTNNFIFRNNCMENDYWWCPSAKVKVWRNIEIK